MIKNLYIELQDIIGQEILACALFIILFLLFVYIPQVFCRDQSFVLAIFKFYFVIIPICFVFAGILDFLFFRSYDNVFRFFY